MTLLQVAAREDVAAGGITLSYKGRTAVVSQDQAMASVGGRIVPLPGPAVRRGRRWYVPLETIPRVLPPILDTDIELRRASRLLIVGNLRVPRVTVRLDSTGVPTRLSIEASPSTLMTTAIEAGRVVVRLDADGLDVAPLPPAGGLLEQARTEGTSVVLMLASGAGQARASRGAGDNLSRLSIEIPGGGQAEGQGRPSAPPPGMASPAPPVGDVTSAPSSAATSRVVVLDPGHGGADSGAIGTRGTYEKTLTLDIARRVKILVESRLALRVVLTRDDDRPLSVDERTTIANASGAWAFISLHLNAAFSPEVAGAEVYQLHTPLTTAGPGAQDVQFTLPVPTGGARTISLVPWALAQVRHRDASTLLANVVDAALRVQIPMSPRPVHDAPMRVLTGLNMPAVVVELAYLSNPEQEASVHTDEFQARAAQALLDALSTYRLAWPGGRR